MLILEFEQNPEGYATEKDDNTPLKLSDLRKTRLTFSQLSKLRLMNDVRKLEREKKIEDVQKQYSVPAEAGDGMPGM